jgi:hypothetical protein
MLVAEKEEKYRTRVPKIPDYLIYEVIDGYNYYYKGYESVLKGKKTFEEIMGASGLQSMIIVYLMEILILGLSKKKYRFATGESGVHIDHRNNLAHDVAIYDRNILTPEKINLKYIDVPAIVGLEVDIKADLSKKEDYDYVYKKTQKLLDFGTDKVIWIFTDSKKIMVATRNDDWKIINWEKDIEILDNIFFNIKNYLTAEKIMGA